MPDAPIYYAHSNDSEDTSSWQLLSDHLDGVAERAERFSSALGFGPWCRTLGLLHDIGKVCPEFQRRLAGSNEKVDHSLTGARYAVDRFGAAGILMAYMLAGHHAGMANGITPSENGPTPLHERLKGAERLRDCTRSFAKEHLSLVPDSAEFVLPMMKEPFFTNMQTNQGLLIQAAALSSYLFARFEYSCLVDADYLDTESYADSSLADLRSDVSDLASLLQRYEEFMREKTSLPAGEEPSLVYRARQDILSDCLAAAWDDPGIFTLNVPTGGGKTLAALGFALHHAIQHGMKRVIIAIPYTSIVEQTARTLKDIFGDHNVLEHHSNYDFESAEGEERIRDRLAVQNWDAPLIVTTNVQLFESIFANRPGKSRKVHNIAESVVILDEAQTLPTGLLKITLGAIQTLCESFRTSFVLGTATQPAFDVVWPFGDVTKEIAIHRDLYEEAFSQRTRFETLGEVGVSELAERLHANRQVLCIVNSRKEAKDLFEAVVSCERSVESDDKEAASCVIARNVGLFHLSTYMTPVHRMRVIAEIRKRLREGKRCVVVSTQLIEAGVDVDFPVVYRELAGIDSLFQAAGRCNREGRANVPGTVFVFEGIDDAGKRYATARTLSADRDVARALIAGHHSHIGEDLIEKYFHDKFKAGDEVLDAEGLFSLVTSPDILSNNFKTMPFATCAEKYKIIEDVTEPVFVVWDDETRHLYQELLGALEPARMARALQLHSIGLFAHVLSEFERLGAVEAVGPFRVLKADDSARSFYSEETGICAPGEEEAKTLVF